MKTEPKRTSVLQSVLSILVVVGAILLIPLIAMQFTTEIDWGLSDFVVMGTLLFIVGLAYEFIVRRTRNKDRRLVFTFVLLLAFSYLWAELAVGIFTNWGS